MLLISLLRAPMNTMSREGWPASLVGLWRVGQKSQKCVVAHAKGKQKLAFRQRRSRHHMRRPFGSFGQGEMPQLWLWLPFSLSCGFSLLSKPASVSFENTKMLLHKTFNYLIFILYIGGRGAMSAHLRGAAASFSGRMAPAPWPPRRERLSAPNSSRRARSVKIPLHIVDARKSKSSLPEGESSMDWPGDTSNGGSVRFKSDKTNL